MLQAVAKTGLYLLMTVDYVRRIFDPTHTFSHWEVWVFVAYWSTCLPTYLAWRVLCAFHVVQRPLELELSLRGEDDRSRELDAWEERLAREEELLEQQLQAKLEREQKLKQRERDLRERELALEQRRMEAGRA